MKRSHLLPLLIWSLLWALFFGTLILAVERLPNSDLSGQFHTFGVYQAREMTDGRLPIWSPGSYGGVPFAADTQAAVFYPPRWLTILLTLPFGFSFYALELEGILHIWLAGVFVYFLAFDITRSQRGSSHFDSEITSEQRSLWALTPSHWAGLLAAVGFGLGGYLTSYPLLQLAVLESVAWLPLVLLLLRWGILAENDHFGRHSKQIPIFLAAGVVLGISALAGHPQTFLHLSLLSAVYFFFLTWQARWRLTWILGIGGLIFLAAGGIAMPSFLPAARFLPATVRDSISYDALSEGFSLIDYVQSVVPGYFSLWLPQYTGLATLFLAIIAVFTRSQWQQKQQRQETVFWLLIAIFAAWLSLGDKGILFELTYRLAPSFSLFRQQERLVNLFSLAIALLGAQGLALFLGAGIAQRRRWLKRAGVIVLVLLLAAGLIYFMSRSTQGKNDWVSLWLRQFVILAGVFIVLWPFSNNEKRNTASWRILALTGLLFLDLFFPLRQAMELQPEPPSVFWPEPAWLKVLQAAEDGRFDSQSYFHANVGELYGLEDIRGISPLKPKALAEFEKLDRPKRWQLLNVHYVLAPNKIEENLTEVTALDQSILQGHEVEGFLYSFDDALPRAWMVYDVISAANLQESLSIIDSPEFDPETEVVLTAADLTALPAVSQPAQPTSTVFEQKPGSQLFITVETDSPGILVISEWDNPDWQVTIDGQPADVLAANYGLMGVFIPAGSHSLSLRYSPKFALSGMLIAFGTLLLVIVVGLRWRPIIPTRPESTAPHPFIQEMNRKVTAGKALSKSRAFWIMTVIIFLGFAMRVFLLGGQELRGDEAFSFLFSQLPFTEVIPELIDQGDPHSPFHYLLLNIWVKAAGDSEMSMRFLSLIPGVLLLPLLFQLGREMMGKKTGILVAILAALSPSLIWLSQDVRNQYMLALLFTSAATWLLVRVSDPLLRISHRWRLIFWVLYGVTAVLSVYGHYYALFALLAHGLYLWFAPGRKRYFVYWVSCGAVIFLFFLPWLIVVWNGLFQAGQLSDPGDPELTQYLVNIGRELIIGSNPRGPWTRWLFLAVSCFVLVGFNHLRRKKPGWAVMLVGWLAGAALMIFLVRFSRSTFNEFYISVASPAWLLLFAAGLISWWFGRRWQRLAAGLILLFVLTATGFSLFNIYYDANFSRTRGYRVMAAEINDHLLPGDGFIAHFPDPALNYYLRNVPIQRELAPAKSMMTRPEIEQQLAQLVEQYDRLWFVPYTDSVWDEEGVVPRWLDYHMFHEQEIESGRLTLQTFRPLRTASETLSPLEGQFDNGIQLEGFYLTLNGQPLNPDDQSIILEDDAILEVSLLWSAAQTPVQNLTVFVHLIDDNGTLLAQHDGIPLFGTRPTETWQPGEQLLDRHEVLLGEGVSGTGRLIAGLYDANTLERLLSSSGEDAFTLANFQFR